MPNEQPPAAGADERPPDRPTMEAEGIPDPNGPPKPVTQEGPGCSPATTAIALLGAGGVALFLLLPALQSSTSGATRSSRLQWQQREAEIERAIRQAETPAEAVAAAEQREENAVHE